MLDLKRTMNERKELTHISIILSPFTRFPQAPLGRYESVTSNHEIPIFPEAPVVVRSGWPAFFSSGVGQ